MKRYYKVVRTDLRSINPNGLKRLYVQYQLNEWVTPTILNSKLFVFDSFGNAKRFAIKGYNKIFECEVKNPSKVKITANYLCSYKLIASFWKNRKNKKRSDYTSAVPIGTIICDEVKLIREIKNV